MDTIRTLLNAIITLLTVPITNIVDTLSAINTKLERLQTIETNLTVTRIPPVRLADVINGIDTRLSLITSEIETMNGRINNIESDTFDINTLVMRVVDQIEPENVTEQQTLYDTVSGTWSRIGSLQSDVFTLRTVTENIRRALRGEPWDGSDVLTLLKAIRDCGCNTVPGPSEGGCISPIFSSAMLVTESGVQIGMRQYAQWSPLNSGDFDFTNTYDFLEPNIEIDRLTWEGWKVYIDSDASVYRRYPNDEYDYRTGEWQTLGDTTTPFAFSVETGKRIKVFLCAPSGGGSQPETCFTASSEYLTYNRIGFFGTTPITTNAAVLPNGTDVWEWPWGDFTNRAIVQGPTPWGIFAPGTWEGWTINLIEGSGIFNIAGTDPEGATFWDFALGPYTMPAGSTLLYIANGGASFIVEVCPPVA